MALQNRTANNVVNYAASVIESKTYNYEGNPITFNRGDAVMVSATEMAKPFGKLVGDWLRLKSTDEFLTSLSADMEIPISGLVVVNKGGNCGQGTWLHEEAALEFARWLSPAFAIWCNRRIKELLRHGVTALPQTYADALRQLADTVEQKEKIQLQLQTKTEQLDESKEWFSIKRWAKMHHKNWRNYKWRVLKALSAELGYEVKKIFDGNYEEVNIYHRAVFEAAYGK